jgi:hypothetical protein
MGRVVLTIAGILWIAFGAAGLLAPAAVVGGVGIDLGSGDALADVRATYGGAQIGIGLFFLYCSRAGARVGPGLIALALIAAGFGLARSAGIVLDGARGGLTFFALATEITAVVLALASLSRASASQQASHA